MKFGSIKIFSACALAVFIGACSKGPAEPQVAAQVAPIAVQESMARGAPDAGGVDRVVVTATGSGPTVRIAIDQAIRLAFEQVNGKSFEAATIGVDAGFKGQIGDSSIEASSSAYADVILTQTQGAVSEFRLLSQQDVDTGVLVQIEASVERYTQPESAGHLRVAISPLQLSSSSYTIGGNTVASAKVARQITDDIAATLLQSRRVTLLDREFDADLQKELARIDAANWGNNDRLRLGQQLAADFLVVGRLDRFEYTRHVRKLRTSDQEIVSYSGGASLLIRVINVATGQVQVAQAFDVDLPQTRPTSMSQTVDSERVIKELISGLAAPAAQTVTLSMFPITVVDVDGVDVVLSQGGNVVKEGQAYQIVLRGKEIKDPQTGRVIGRIEKPCCTVLVTTVTPEMSYGIIQDQQIADVAAVFSPGSLELRGAVEQAPKSGTTSSDPTVARVAAPPPKATAPRDASAGTKAISESEEDPDW